MLVFHRFPKTLYKHVIPPGALAIHTDSNGVVLEILRKRQAGVLTALVGVHDFGLAVFRNRFFERIQAKTGILGGVGLPLLT